MNDYVVISGSDHPNIVHYNPMLFMVSLKRALAYVRGELPYRFLNYQEGRLVLLDVWERIQEAYGRDIVNGGERNWLLKVRIAYETGIPIFPQEERR